MHYPWARAFMCGQWPPRVSILVGTESPTLAPFSDPTPERRLICLCCPSRHPRLRSRGQRYPACLFCLYALPPWAHRCRRARAGLDRLGLRAQTGPPNPPSGCIRKAAPIHRSRPFLPNGPPSPGRGGTFLSTPFHKFADVFPHEFACRESGLPVPASSLAHDRVCHHPAGAQFEFLDTLSHGLTPVATGVSPPVGAYQSNAAQYPWLSFSAPSRLAVFPRSSQNTPPLSMAPRPSSC